MKRLLYILILAGSASLLNGQTVSQDNIGKVSFVSSQNVYVKFKSTEGISAGDTLYITSGGRIIPAFVVKNLSSMSCVCQQITAENIPVDHLVISKARISNKPAEIFPAAVTQEVIVQQVVQDTSKIKEISTGRKQNIHGSFSVQSYSDLSNTPGGNSQRYRYIFSLDARNIGNSRLSAETCVGFGYKAGEWQQVQNDIFNALKIYSLALKYDIGKSMNVSLGRRINPRISNIGPMDGIEFEASIKRFTIGAVSGFRPDYTNFSFNSKLFQAGAYVSFDTRNQAGYTQSSMALMQQMNGSNTDRRFIYLQHSNNLGKNLSFFSTCEIDLYKLVNNTPTSTFDLTGLYLSLRYRFSGNLWVSGSYDTRKNVIYYETYKTYLDHMLETAMRQGYRLQINYHISPSFMTGINGGYRFIKDDPNPSENVYGFVTYNKISGFNLTATLSGTYLLSGYMNGIIAGGTLSHSFFHGKLVSDIGYSYVDYTLPEGSTSVKQNIGEIYLSMPLSRFVFISFNYEGTFEKSDKYNRIYGQIRFRF
jgi:hypothetical protein